MIVIEDMVEVVTRTVLLAQLLMMITSGVELPRKFQLELISEMNLEETNQEETTMKDETNQLEPKGLDFNYKKEQLKKQVKITIKTTVLCV